MTMLALTLMVGIVIDDAIVVLENIYRFVEEKGMDPFQAAIEGTREIGLAGLGDDAVAARGVYSGRIYDRHRRPIYVVVRPDGGGRDRGFADRFVYADADACGTLDKDAKEVGNSRARGPKGTKSEHHRQRRTA